MVAETRLKFASVHGYSFHVGVLEIGDACSLGRLILYWQILVYYACTVLYF